MADIFIPRPIGPLQPGKPVSSGTQKTADKTANNGFEQILQSKISSKDIKFSGHAIKRMESRGITLSGDQMDKLVDAVNRVEAKGARESLVLMEDMAMVVSVKNRTVITAVDREGLKENVFTNIDSAVIV